MQNSKIIIIGTIIFFAIGFIYSEYRANKPSTNMPAVSDGEYYVQIGSVNQEAKTAIFKHITYFVGADAFNSASHEIECEGKEITECVPTLKKGYYIRPSIPESAFSDSIANSEIFLSNSRNVLSSIEGLNQEINLLGYESAFKINVEGGKVAKIEELTRYNNSQSFGLPRNYTLDSYTVAKETDVSCVYDGDCETPGEYLMMSSCPYTSICDLGKCVVVCPDYK